MLCPEYIFLDDEKKEISFCCLPDYHHPVQEQFRELTEYLLPKLDHEDPTAVNLGYGIYRKPWSQGCSWKILRNCFIDLRKVKRKLQRAIQNQR